MSTDFDDPSEPADLSSPIDVHTALQLHYRPPHGEIDRRPPPGVIAEIFNTLILAFTDTLLALDLERILWSMVNDFHRACDRIDRELDRNVLAQQEAQRGQDGSEVQSVELERLIDEGRALTERLNSMELCRDQAAEQFACHTGSPWYPRSGSMVNHRNMTAAIIDSREFQAERRRARNELLVPRGPKIVFSGGTEFNDVAQIWDTLDRVHAKYQDMWLAHGGSETGGERIASCWANARKVPQIGFKPDWARYPRHRSKEAPFKRNDKMLEDLPKGVIVAGDGGIQQNLADKAKKFGVKVWKLRSGGA
jgi:YspA, cpYpsA-related SLOG family